MINLSKLADNEVSIQFKHGSYVMAVMRGMFIPVSGSNDPQQSGPPIIADRLEGRLRIDDGQPILTYANPANPQEQIDFYFDAEDVCAAWMLRKIQIFTGMAAVAPAAQ